MRTHALQQAPEMARPSRAASPPPVVLAQRRSSFGGGGSMIAPPIRDGGRPLDAATRSQMEAGFGRDFSTIRIHDDARAHDDARSLSARAYAAGDHIVFGQGSYRPETPDGRALIAHELAHSVQQAGVQMKADGALPAGADAELERQADRAALDVMAGRSAPALSRIGAPAVFRADVNASIANPPAAGTAVTPQAGPPQNLPPGMTIIKDDPPGIGTNELVVGVTNFALPVEKGLGPWVQDAYTQASTGGRLVFSPLIDGGKVAAYKEGGEDYKSIWLGMYGFSDTKGLAVAFNAAAKTNDEVKAALADKDVAALIKGMGSTLQKSGCDIDHIVEKQMGGTSIPSNLQLLVSGKNQASGRQAYQELVKLVDAIRDPKMRGTGVRKLQLHLQAVTVPAGTTDASYVVERLLRKGLVTGKDEVKAKAAGKPVTLTAGGVGETIDVTDTGATPLDSMAKRIVPGMRLATYTRGAAGAKSKIDKVAGELDSRAVAKTGVTKADIALTAEMPPAAPAGTAPAGAAATAPAAGEENAADIAEQRVLKLDKAANKKIAFYYPYLSPGTLTSVALDPQGNLTGEGIIKPSVPFLGDLKVRYGPDLLEMIAPLGADKLKPPISGFRFTGGELALALSPAFVPKGTVNFEIGPKGRPVILGDITAKYEGGAFVATGNLLPGGKIPGITQAKGSVQYHSEKGWSGKLTATSSSIPNSEINAELGFTSEGGRFRAYGEGGIITTINGSKLNLKVGWHGGAVSYSGGVTIRKPMPLVDKVELKGGYANEVLSLSGDADITWKSIAAKMHITYRRRDGDRDGKFGGKAGVTVKTEKALGHLDLSFDEEGRYWGKGDLTYQVTKEIRPKLGVELTKDQRIKMLGSVALGNIALTKKWPSPEGGKLTLIKGISGTFDIPTPIPLVTVFGRLKVSAGLTYSVGPVMLTGVKFEGELYPLEDDPQIAAKLTGKLAVPARAGVYGTFGATIGARMAAGLISAEGGIEITPSLGIKGEAGVSVDAQYQGGSFSMEAEAYAIGAMEAALAINLVATLSGAWGLVSYSWDYPAWSTTRRIGPELKLTLGKVAYKNGEFTWPSLSQIKLEPENIDPIDIIRDLVRSRDAKEN